jgi:HD-GYP domain-containing protein (c-di-GMP phosphodiesterase class II)
MLRRNVNKRLPDDRIASQLSRRGVREGKPAEDEGVLKRELRRRADELRSAHRETIVRLAAALELRSEETGRHVERIARHAERVAVGLGLPAADVELIALASPLHDIGKIALPDAILQKPGPLTSEERRVMETHTAVGHRLLSGSRSDVLQFAAEIALNHHERFDGRGYPRGIARTAIPLEARIVTICDVFDALTHDRVYRTAYPVPTALEIMRSERGTRFDPRLFDLFLATLDAVDTAAAAPRAPQGVVAAV